MCISSSISHHLFFIRLLHFHIILFLLTSGLYHMKTYLKMFIYCRDYIFYFMIIFYPDLNLTLTLSWSSSFALILLTNRQTYEKQHPIPPSGAGVRPPFGLNLLEPFCVEFAYSTAPVPAGAPVSSLSQKTCLLGCSVVGDFSWRGWIMNWEALETWPLGTLPFAHCHL